MAEQGFTLASPAFEADGLIPAVHTFYGENRSHELNWMHAPQQAGSFALIVDDPDAPSGTFTHWVLFDIPADTRSLPARVEGVGLGGKDHFFQHDGYGGPCPPPNHGKHRYYFRLHALDVPSLDLPAGTSRSQVEQAVQGHIHGQAQYMGRYERRTS